jgi:hypothetical protein
MILNFISKKSFVITIGNLGAIVALYQKDNIISKVFLEEFNDKAREDLKTLFNQNKSAPIYILLDTIDQSYKKKIYPAVTKSDLKRLVLRDTNSDPDKESLKGNIILNPKKAKAHSWECLYIASSKSDVINSWIDFLLEMPNYVAGIYMLPIETFHLVKNLKKLVKKTEKKHDITCVVLQTKASGVRQVIFSKEGIAFTRVVNYDFNQPDFLQKYEADIYSSFEYSKRVVPDIVINDFDIINVFSDDILETLKKSTNLELKYTNLTLNQAALEVGYSNVEKDEKFCDILISKAFAKAKKKILRFSIPKIDVIGKMFIGLMTTYFLSLALILLIVISFLYMFISQSSTKDLIKTYAIERTAARAEFERVKAEAYDGDKIVEDGKVIDLETVMDFGRLESSIGKDSDNFVKYYSKLNFLKDHNVKLFNYSYSIVNFNDKSPEGQKQYQIKFTGKLYNKSGDIEDLFSKFDLFVAAVKKNFGDNSQLKYLEIPKNVDFSQKYYDFNIDFTVTTSL